jgi:hypothetical protein
MLFLVSIITKKPASRKADREEDPQLVEVSLSYEKKGNGSYNHWIIIASLPDSTIISETGHHTVARVKGPYDTLGQP